MTQSELIAALSRRTHLPQSVCREVVDAFVAEVGETVPTGERIVLPGFGTFVFVKLAPRELFGEGRKSEVSGKIRFRQSRRSNGEAGRRDR